MATPEETALKAIDAQAKRLQKMISYLQTLAKKMVTSIATLVDGLKALLAKLAQLRAILPSALMNAAKKGVQFLTKTLKEIPKRIKDLIKYFKGIVKIIKNGRKETLEALLRGAFAVFRVLVMGLGSLFKQIQDVLKPLERLRSTIKQMEMVIRSIVENIADVLAKLLSISTIKSLLASVQKKIKDVQTFIGETEKNVIKFGNAVA